MAETSLTKKIEDQLGLIQTRQHLFQQIATKYVTPERQVRLLQFAMGRQPKLAECTSLSILQGYMDSVSMGLEIGIGGQGWLVPFSNRKTNAVEAVFIPGYRGLLLNMIRSGMVTDAEAHVVYEHEWDGTNGSFHFSYGANPRLEHIPCMTGERGAPVAWYVLLTLANGTKKWHAMRQEDVEKHRQRSMAKDSGPWVTDYDAMAFKTCLKEMNRWMPNSPPALERALDIDNALDSGGEVPLVTAEAEQIMQRGTDTRRQARSRLSDVVPKQAEPPKAPEAEGHPPAITPEQFRTIFSDAKAHGIEGDAEVLKMVANLLGVEDLKSVMDLTRKQAEECISLIPTLGAQDNQAQ